jgi:hypothetical protein
MNKINNLKKKQIRSTDRHMIPVGEQEACRKIRQHLQFNHEIDAAYLCN